MPLKVLAVSAEAFPIAKTGGLGDAVGGLCRSLHASGVQVTLMLPAYRDALRHVRNVRRVARLQDLPGGDVAVLVGESPELGVPVLLVQNDQLYDRDGLYGDHGGVEYPDNAVRFATLAQAAALVAAGKTNLSRPDIVHAHDWHAALTPLYLRQIGATNVKTILTLHNLAFQGVFPMDMAPLLGIEPWSCSSDGAEFWGQLSFLKAGIRYADMISVVSNNYAREILTSGFGCGLEGVLADRASDLVAIPNGIDTALWNPRHDSYLPGRAFDSDDMGNKAICKLELQHYFGLKQDPRATVMVMGSRLTTQKMADIAVLALPVAFAAHPSLQVCVLGEGDRALEASLSEIGRCYPQRCGVHIGYEERQAHLLHAGADMLLHGSRFEPFGLTPLYSMRYGTIPIGSRVGGMADTIIDPGLEKGVGAMCAATGVLFEGDGPDDMIAAIDRAMALRALPDIWAAMQRNAMGANFSWAHAAPAYLCTYRSLRPDVIIDRVAGQHRDESVFGRVLQLTRAGAVLRAAHPDWVTLKPVGSSPFFKDSQLVEAVVASHKAAVG